MGRILAKVALVLLLLFVALVLFVRSPWGQDIILGKMLGYITDKTHTVVTVDRLFLTFSGNLFVEGLYMEDQKGDTLIHSKTLEASIAIMPLVRGKKFVLRSLDWSGVKAHIKRAENEDFNYTFLIKAFAAPDTVSQKKVDTTAAMTIEIGDVHLNTFKIDYKDQLAGTEMKLNLGALDLEMDRFDLETMDFQVDWVQLVNSNIDYQQTKPLVDTAETPTTVLPSFVLDGLRLNNVAVNYTSLPDSIKAKAHLGELLVELPLADLKSNKIELANLRMKGSDISYRNGTTHTDTPADTVASMPPAQFEWPEWEIVAERVDLEDNHVVFQNGKKAPQVGSFDPNAMELSKILLKINDLRLKEKEFSMELEAFSFREKSGIDLKNLAFDLSVDDTETSLSSLDLGISNSSVEGNAKLSYGSLQKFIKSPENIFLDVSLEQIELHLEDAMVFVPALKGNVYLDSLAQKPLQGNLDLKGNLQRIEVNDSHLRWGQHTDLTIKGTVNGVMEPETMKFDISPAIFDTRRSDLLRFVNETQLGVALPETVRLKLTAAGSLRDITAKAALDIPEGNILLKGRYSTADFLAFDADLEVRRLQIGKLLRNPELGTIAFTAKTSGRGTTINTLDADLRTNFSQLNLLGYDFSALKLNGEIEQGKGHIDLNFKDKNLDMDSRTTVQLDSISSKVQLLLDLQGANLMALGLTQQDIRAKFKLSLDHKGNASDFDIKGRISDAVAVKDNATFPMDTLDLSLEVDSLGTIGRIKSGFLNVDIKSDHRPQMALSALARRLKGYWNGQPKETLYAPVQVKMDLSLTKTPLLGEVFLTGLAQMDSIQMRIDLDEAEERFVASLSAPFVMYNGSTLDSLEIYLQGEGQRLDYNLGLAGITSGSVAIKKLNFDGTISERAMSMDFNAYDGDETLAHLSSQLTMKGDTLAYHIEPEELILNKREWQIPLGNNIRYATDHLEVSDFVLSRNGQEMSLRTSRNANDALQVNVDFSNFRLSTLTHLFNPDDTLAKGTVMGNINVQDPFGKTGLLADLHINELEVMHIPLGNLALNAEAKNGGAYDFNLGLKGGDVDLDLQGDYIADKDGAKLDLELVLNELRMNALEQFMEGDVSETSGNISGKLSVTGTTTEPIYEGNFNFNAASLMVNSLNTKFSLADESIRMDNTGIYFGNFTIVDANKNTFALDGTIGTESFLNPTFDLRVLAEDFQVINATKDDNEMYYGKVRLDADITVAGDLSIPIVKGNMKINEGSNFTFVIPESQLEVTEREGVVVFVNKENPDDILTSNTDDASADTFTGFQIDAQLNVDNNSTFKIVIDERTGDNFQISGKGTFNLGVEPNGRTSISGRYVVEKGHYEASLYNLVRRKFEITKGSTIIWNGDPMDATLNVRALYKVETSAAPLMAANNSASSAAENSRYKQVLPFYVYLNVDGSLLQPEISFNLDIPEDEQGTLGGNVYAQVQQLNKQEEELNKQVFSLLVLNRFFPGSTSDGSSGGAASIARDNVNKVLSGQLNNFSDQLMGNSGVALDFGLDSYTDYQGDAPQDRTQLDINASKSLFNDRLVVQVGSEVDIEGSGQANGESTPVIGNVSLEYLLTENGRFRLKGFRKNEFESVIDGQLIVTGFALIFNREFNKFKELWIKQVREEEDGQGTKKNEKQEPN